MFKGIRLKHFAVALIMIFPIIIFASCGKAANGELRMLCYGDYFDESIIGEFENRYDVDLIYDTYDTAEEMYTVVSNGGSDYDVICTSDYMIEKMIGEGLLDKIDFNNVSNLANIDTIYLQKSESFDPGNLYSVPYMVGVAGIAYNKTLTGSNKIDSWNDLWDEQFKESIVMPDSLREAYMIALLKDGKSLNSSNEVEIQEASKELIKQKSLVYKYANDNARDMVADGSAALGMVWNGEYEYIIELNPDAEFIVPSEGSEFFIDSWVISSKANNKANAEKWIDFVCDAEIAKINFDYLHYTTPNKAAMELIDKKFLNNPAIFPSAETIAKCESLRMQDAEAQALLADNWKRVKSAN